MAQLHGSTTLTLKKTAAAHFAVLKTTASVTPKVTLKVAPKRLIRTTLASTEMGHIEIGGQSPKPNNGATFNGRDGDRASGNERGSMTTQDISEVPGDAVALQQRSTPK